MNFFEGLCLFIGTMAIFIGIAFGCRQLDIYLSPCVEVYEDSELIYKGSSVFYSTESRGTATIFYQYDERIFFQRKVKEIMSNKISIETIKCETKKEQQ